MNRKIVIVLGIAALALGGLSTNSFATCDSAKNFLLSFGAADRTFDYSQAADANKTVGGGVFIGRWWQAGSRGASNEGLNPVSTTNCPESSYVLTTGGDASSFYGTQGGDWGIGLCDNVGPCSSGALVVLFQTQNATGSKAYYAVGKVLENANSQFDFAEGPSVNWKFVEVPRPRVSSSSRGGSTVTVGLNLDAPAGARGEPNSLPAESILTGYQIVRFEGAADPGRAASAWTNLGSPLAVAANGASVGGVGVVCSGTTNDVWVATRPVFDGGQYLGDYVSASTRVECDPAVADPRFDLVKPNRSGRGTIRSNR